MTAGGGILEAVAQAPDDQAAQIFKDYLRRDVRIGRTETMAAEVQKPCGPQSRRSNGGSVMVSRWKAASLMRANRGFRRVHRHDVPGQFEAALARSSAAIPAPAPEEVAAARSSCAPAGMAAE